MYRHLVRLGFFALFVFCLGSAAPAATWTVTTAADEADGSCFDGDCSLRDAIASAATGDTVEVPAGSFALSLGQLSLSKNLTIRGAGARSSWLDGQGVSRHFLLNAGFSLTLSGFTLSHGRANFAGSIYSSGNLTLSQVSIENNQADFAGGIYSDGDQLTILQSTIAGNSANGVGGIYAESGTVLIDNSTVSGNRANLLAGGLALFGPATLRQVTIAGNTVTDSKHWQSGGAFLAEAVAFTGTLFDGNAPKNCDPVVTPTGSFNLDSDSSCTIDGAGNLSGEPAQLLALANNGGPTDTRALAPSSPAVDVFACALPFDQRGTARPQGSGCDIGAFELRREAAPATLCTTETFSSGLGALSFAFVGDADQGGAVASGGRVQLTSDGSSFYHGSDNGGFLHRSVTGDFRIEVELTGFPVNAGGGYRRSGISVRTGTGPNDPRVFVEFLPQHPSYLQSALMFDYRGTDGVAKELASTKLGLATPVRLAIDRRGNQFTAWYSVDGSNWVKPAGAAGGTVTIAMPATVEVGLMQASYDTATTLTSELDNFELCQPNPEPLPPLPPAVACVPGQPLDLVYLLDLSGSAAAAFPGGPTRLDAARAALAALNSRVAANLPGSRVAVVGFLGGPAPAYTTGAGATVIAPLTADFSAAAAAAAAINPQAINPSTSSSLSHGLAAARELLESSARPEARPLVLLLGDGFVNVDLRGNGPLAYRSSEMAAISLIRGLSYRGIGETAWLGNWNGPLHSWDGEALANAMQQGLLLKSRLPQASLHTIGLVGGGPYRTDLLGFLADYGSGRYAAATDTAAVFAAVDDLFSSISCGQP